MSRNSFKVLSLVLTVVFALGILLTGCGSGKTGETAAAGTTQAAQTTAAGTKGEAPLPEYTINWYMPNTVQPDQDAVTAEINKITKEKINATINLNIIDWGNYDQKMQVLMAAGSNLDLIFTSNWTNDYIQAVNKGAYLEITKDMLEKFAPNVLVGVPERSWPAAYVNGKLYAIINTQVEGRTPGILGQKKYFDKYGVDLSKITKLEDLTPYYEKMKAGEPGLIPFATTSSTTLFNDIALTYNIEVFSQNNPAAIYTNDDSTKVMNYFAAPETKAFLKLMREWYQKGIIRKDAATVKDDSADLKAGKIISLPQVINPDTAANQAAKFNMKAADVVSKTFTKTFMSTGSIIATLTAISKSSKDPERSLMLYNLLYDTQDTRLMNLLSFGIKDKHYTLQDDVVTPIPNSGYLVASGWEYGNLFNNYRQSADQPKWYPTGPDMNNSANTSKILGFSFNPEPVKTELAQSASVVSEYYSGLFNGSVDPDKYLPEFLDKLNKAGAEKIIAETQKQIDAWKSAK